MMKKLLFACLSAVVLTIGGCADDNDCPDGYGPRDCNVTWIALYEGSWSGTSCDNPVFLTVARSGAKSIFFNGQFYGNLTDWNRFNIPDQNYPHPITGDNIHVSGSGSLVESGSSYDLRMTITYVTVAGTQFCSESYHK